jgi:GNAT superfamily N-acetyltransferase
VTAKVTASDEVREYRREQYLVSTDRHRIDLDVIHGFLVESYWAKGIPRDVVAGSIANSLCFGLYSGDQQVGFARVISDYATYAYLGDVFILEQYRGCGLGKWLMECIMAHPQLQSLRRWGLVTRDAHGLYAQFGFTPLANPERHMELYDANVYKQKGRTRALPENAQ